MFDIEYVLENTFLKNLFFFCFFLVYFSGNEISEKYMYTVF